MSGVPPWTCDQCGKPITKVEDGWVEWLNGDIKDGWEGTSHSLRLVHTRPASPENGRLKHACYHDTDYWFEKKRCTVADLPLSEFIGDDGLITLLSFLADKRFSDQNEVLEMIKRLHTPKYEQARPYFEPAIADGAFEPRSTPTYYDQEELEAVLRWKRKREQEG